MTDKYTLLFALCFALGSASAQCPDPTFDGQTFYDVHELSYGNDDEGYCVFGPTVNPAYADSLGMTYGAALSFEDACPFGYQVCTDNDFGWFLFNNAEAFIPDTLSTGAFYDPFGNVTLEYGPGTGEFPYPEIAYYSGTYYTDGVSWNGSANFGYPRFKSTPFLLYISALNTAAGYTFEYNPQHPLWTDEVIHLDSFAGFLSVNDTNFKGQYYCRSTEIIGIVPEPPVVDVPCPADINEDGVVGLLDLLDLLAAYEYICE